MDPNHEAENAEPGLFDNFGETQKEILAIEIKKVRAKLFTIAIVFFAFDLFALLVAGIVTPSSLLIISILPAILAALALLSAKEPMLAMVIAALIIAALWVYVITILGARGAMAGWLAKAIIIYLVIAGFQSAREAQRIKKELRA